MCCGATFNTVAYELTFTQIPCQLLVTEYKKKHGTIVVAEKYNQSLHSWTRKVRPYTLNDLIATLFGITNTIHRNDEKATPNLLQITVDQG